MEALEELGHLKVVRETGSVLCRIAAWDCFGTLRHFYRLLRGCAGKLGPNSCLKTVPWCYSATQSHAVTFPRLPKVHFYVISKWPTHTQNHGNCILVPRAAIFLVSTGDRANVAIGLRQLTQGITCVCSTLTFFLAVCLY